MIFWTGTPLQQRWSLMKSHHLIIVWSVDPSPRIRIHEWWSYFLKAWERDDDWVVVSNIFSFHPYFGKWSSLTNIFQMGWNHQLGKGWWSWETHLFKIFLDHGDTSLIKVLTIIKNKGYPPPPKEMSLKAWLNWQSLGEDHTPRLAVLFGGSWCGWRGLVTRRHVTFWCVFDALTVLVVYLIDVVFA